MPNDWRRSRASVSIQSPRQVTEFERYMAVALSLMLTMVLIVGAAGYARIRRTFSAAAGAASASENSQYTMPRNTSSFIARK